MLARLRAWWERHWMGVVLGAYYFGVIAVGALGFREPSLSMRQFLGAAHLIYAVSMITLGSCALWSMLEKSRRSEAVCLVAIGAMTVLHGVIIATSPGGGGIQTGMRLIISLPGATVFAYYRSEAVQFRRDVRADIKRAQEAADAQQ